jgi:hypothetical protein
MVKKRLITGVVTIILGLLIAFSPSHIFKVCEPMGGHFMTCHWTARAELGVGLLVAALGVSLLFFASEKTRLGLSLSVFLAGILALSIPHALIGGCDMETMQCRSIAFPALTVFGVLVAVGAALQSYFLFRFTAEERQ